MDTTAATTTSTATNTAASTVTTAKAKTTGLSGDYQTFLKMLTTQLQNQDPLNPMESSDFAVQLATFSGVEQQVKTNELLTAMTGSGALSGIGQYAGWIGMEARVPAAAPYDGRPLSLMPSPAKEADAAKLVVTDGTGKVVATTDTPAEAKPITWRGTNGAGDPLPWGQYSFSLQSYKEGNLIGTSPVEVYARVTETRLSTEGTAMLILEGGGEVEAAKATALRPAS